LIRSPRRRWERQRREAAAARHAASGRSCDVLWLLAEAGGLLGGGVLVADPHGGCKAAAHGSATETMSAWLAGGAEEAAAMEPELSERWGFFFRL
jgi:hypothetical protein